MCECVKKMDEALAPKNARIARVFEITRDLDFMPRMVVATEKIDKAKRDSVPLVTANYCPFCGEKQAISTES